MGKEIKTEKDWLGREKDVIYEDGKKIGETRHETDWLGRPKDVTYDTRGEKVSETRREQGFFDIISGTEKEVTYGTDGRKVSETRYEEDIFGNRKGVVYEDGKKIGELKREDGIREIISGTKRRVLHETSDHDVDLTRRTSKEVPQKAKKHPDESYSHGGYVSSDSPRHETESRERYNPYHPDPKVRKVAVNEMTYGFGDEDSRMLEFMAANDEDTTIRIAAINKIKNNSPFLYRLATQDKNPAVRRAAVGNITDEYLLDQIAKLDNFSEVRREALRKLGRI